jgi:hypothetical protein
MKRHKQTASMVLDLAAVAGGMPYRGETTYYYPQQRSSGHGNSHQSRREPERREPPRREPEPQYYIASGTAPRGLSGRREDSRAAQWAVSQAR